MVFIYAYMICGVYMIFGSSNNGTYNQNWLSFNYSVTVNQCITLMSQYSCIITPSGLIYKKHLNFLIHCINDVFTLIRGENG